MYEQFGNEPVRGRGKKILRSTIVIGLMTALSTGELSAEEAGVTADTESIKAVEAKKKPANSDAAVILPTVSVVGQQDVSATDPVDGYVANKSLSGSKTNTPLIEIPQSISVINKDEFVARAAQNITQVVAYTPGILSGLFGPSTRDDYFRVRGFDAAQYLDGTRLFSSNNSYGQLRVEPYRLERIEVLRGPASMLYGQNPPGGLINMISKRPTDTPFHEIQFLGGSFDRVQGSADFSGPIDDKGEWLYRMTALGRNSDTQVDLSKDDRYFVAPSLTWKPNDATSFTFLSHYQKDEAGNSMQFLPYSGTVLANPNGKIPTNRFLGEPDYDRYEREQFSLGYAFQHRFNETWAVRQNLRYADVSSNYPVVFALGYVTDDNDIPIDYRTISRLAGLYQDQVGTFTLDNQLQSDFNTGFMKHTVLTGVDFRQISGDRKRGFGFPADIDAFNPVYGQPFDLPIIDTLFNQEQDQIGIYGQDQIKLDRWIATIGVRYDWSTSNTSTIDYYNPDTDSIDFNNPTITRTQQDDEAFTYRTALSYLFDSGFAPYFSYSESFEPTPDTDFFFTPFKPTTGQQYEFGLKYQPPGFNAFVALSAFHLTQQNVVTPDPDPAHQGFSIQTGEARSQGVELEGKASLDIGLDITSAYSYIDTEVTKTNEADQLGKNLTYTPEHQASVWLDYTHKQGDFAGLGLGSGLRYIGANYGDLSNSQKAPGYVLVDASVHYDLGKLHPKINGLRLGVNMSNLLDREYVVSCGDGSCFYGDRRSVLASLRYNW